MQTIESQLFVEGLALNVFLGWTDQEQQEAQTIWLDLEIYFADPIQACDSDLLKDTVCYAHLIHHLKNQFETKKKFRLIEHLSQEIYRAVKSQIKNKHRLKIRLTKHPKIEGLNRVRFVYGEV